MKRSFVLDKTLYILMALFIVMGFVLPGCAVQEGDYESDEEMQDITEDDDVQESPLSSDVENIEVDNEFVDEIPAPSASEAPVEESVVDDAEPVVETAEPESTTVYVDGTYTQTGSYNSPAGPETVTVTITVADDVVTGVSVASNAVNETSKSFQNLFIAGVNSVVVGKSLDELGSLGPVNGSSLTPNGFNSALASIKGQAQN